jgi:hypothetical protein
MIKKIHEEITSALVWVISAILIFIKSVYLFPSESMMIIYTKQHAKSVYSFLHAGVSNLVFLVD